ncbi:MAG: hypothetical protein KAG06_04075 [Methylococcales bacterium]|nr:hypothetical protein [Methylococcales bacterium]
MAYGHFKSVSEVARLFDIEVSDNKVFVETLDINIPLADFKRLEQKLSDKLNFFNETTICERIISPILELVADQYDRLKIWSHVPYNVDKEKGLVGEPDYLIAEKTKYGDMGIPPVCIIEAKKDNFDEGWTQALAEMVAASMQGQKTCYGIVTTGNTWQFAYLKKSIFIRDPTIFSATINLQDIFDRLNWVFNISHHKI